MPSFDPICPERNSRCLLIFLRSISPRVIRGAKVRPSTPGLSCQQPVPVAVCSESQRVQLHECKSPRHFKDINRNRYGALFVASRTGAPDVQLGAPSHATALISAYYSHLLETRNLSPITQTARLQLPGSKSSAQICSDKLDKSKIHTLMCGAWKVVLSEQIYDRPDGRTQC